MPPLVDTTRDHTPTTLNLTNGATCWMSPECDDTETAMAQ